MKQKRKEKAGKWSVPVPKVLPVPQHESVSIMDTIIRYVIFSADPNPPSIGFSRVDHNVYRFMYMLHLCMEAPHISVM